MSGHHHDHNHAHAGKNIALAFALNLFFSVFEFAGGILTGSMAILSDAVHDAGDALSLGVAWYLQRLSNKGGDEKFSYGYRRFSLLGALFISIVLVISSFFIIRESILRLAAPGQPHAGGMMVMAVAGLLVNGLAAWRLNRGKSISERAVFLHMMEDVLGWAAVLVVGGIMYFVDAPFLDPLLSIGISLWVLWNVWGNLKAALKVMLQGAPEGIDAESLKKEILEIDGVVGIHDLHLWSLDGQQAVATLHVAVGKEADWGAVRDKTHEVCKRHGIGHSTVEVEQQGSGCDYGECAV